MQEKILRYFVAVILAFGMGAHSVQAADPAPGANDNGGRAGVFGISGDVGYYTYGMDDVNNHFLSGGSGSINGGLGYGGSAKLNISNNLAAKIGIDYLSASTSSTVTLFGTTYNAEVDLPATMLLIGGEYVFLPLGPFSLKLTGGYLLTSIYNGQLKGISGNVLGQGSVTGSGSGFQLGLGLEFFLGSRFSVEGDLAYNNARIDSVSFLNVSSGGVWSVDYSGLVVKAAATIYIF